MIGRYQLLIFDLDGTLYVDGIAASGAITALDDLRRQGYQLRFMTNTTTKTQQQLCQYLSSMGFTIAAHELISAPEAARIYLRQRQQEQLKKIRIWPVLDAAILSDFAEFISDEQQPDFVVLGDMGEYWTPELLNRIFNVLQRGAVLLALHKNKFWQIGDGLHADIGLFVAGLEYVTGKPAQIIGKPAIGFFDQVLKSADCLPAHALMIGDDIDSDIDSAQQLGLHTVLVKTGKYRDSYTRQSAIHPHAILTSVAELPDYLKRKNPAY